MENKEKEKITIDAINTLLEVQYEISSINICLNKYEKELRNLEGEELQIGKKIIKNAQEKLIIYEDYNEKMKKLIKNSLEQNNLSIENFSKEVDYEALFKILNQ